MGAMCSGRQRRPQANGITVDACSGPGIRTTNQQRMNDQAEYARRPRGSTSRCRRKKNISHEERSEIGTRMNENLQAVFFSL